MNKEKRKMPLEIGDGFKQWFPDLKPFSLKNIYHDKLQKEEEEKKRKWRELLCYKRDPGREKIKYKHDNSD